MAYSRLFTPRNLAFFSMFSLGGGYLTMKSRALAVKQRERGDYSVTVDRSGRSRPPGVLARHPTQTTAPPWP
ncbi:hypothetical protein PSPO01_06390 [Paraphaeosphaeria sporulosa]